MAELPLPLPLPSGTVTFLFTDIEGSTGLWARDRVAMEKALAGHDVLLADAIAAHGGVVFKTVGDAFHAAFGSPMPALLAAFDAQRALGREAWGDLGPLRVRMALHTGMAEMRGGDYFGPALNRVARLLETGHGDQILLSGAAQQLVREYLPADLTLLDLGEHRLRDLLEPEHVYQVLAAGLVGRFPPLKSLDRHPTTLPIQPNLLVGREQELAAVEALLRRDDVRLVTLTGVGGTGKTRLGLQVAAEMLDTCADGAFFVDLSGIADASLVLPTIASTLRVREGGGQSPRDALVAYLADRRLLLVLDNFEQVLGAASAVADLLGACAGVKVLATSRAPLRLRAEHEYPVPPLPTPDPRHLPPLADLAEIDAVKLFVQRATAARPDFTLAETNAAPVAAICARLDGLPLAIELAAARVKALPLRAILERLTNRLKLLTGGAIDLPERQRTLRAAIAWSHELLSLDERALFRRLAVFAGGFALEAAEAVVNTAGDLNLEVFDGVAALVDWSLLRQIEGPDGEARFAMLETLREFGLERLMEANEGEATRRAHAAWCVALAELAEPNLVGQEQGRWLVRLEFEHDNLRAALTATGDDVETNLRLAGALYRFWEMRGHFSEGRVWLERTLEGGSAQATLTRANALHGAGVLAFRQGDFIRARALSEESLAIGRKLGDKRGIARSLNNLGLVARAQGGYERAVALHEESLAIGRELRDKRGIARSLHNLGNVAQEQGDYRRAVALYEESLPIRQELGDKRGIARSLHNLGNVVLPQGDYRRAVALYEESLASGQELGDKVGIARSLHGLGVVAQEQGDYARAGELYEESLTIKRELGDKLGLVWSLEGIAALAASLARAERAARLLGAAAALRDALGSPAEAAVRDRNDRALTEAQAQLDEPAFAELLASGRGLCLEQAVAEALTLVREIASTRPIGNGRATAAPALNSAGEHGA